MNTPTTKPRLLGGIGIILGLVSIAVAFLSPWIQEQIDPPARPVEEVAVDIAAQLADAAKAKIKGEEYTPAYQRPEKASRFLFPTVIIAGMIAAGFGVAGSLRSEDKFFSGGAIALGVGAAVVQWSFLIAGALILVMLVLAAMSLLGGSP
jgi:hypothetical protein